MKWTKEETINAAEVIISFVILSFISTLLFASHRASVESIHIVFTLVWECLLLYTPYLYNMKLRVETAVPLHSSYIGLQYLLVLINNQFLVDSVHLHLLP